MPQHSKAARAESGKNTPDEALIEATRKGNKTAFAELWRRHYRSGITVAHSFTSLDADDLVSEAFVRIYKRTIEGGGPRGAFRPYLYTTIRNLASTWGTASQKLVQVDDLEVLDDAEPTESAEDPIVRSLDSDMTVKAYQSLPARWQTVLWYTEVEGLDPHEVAPILGITANSVAALSYRAREGLRKAWLQAHVTDATASGPCAWSIERMGENSRHSLTEREQHKLNAHLAECERCSNVSAEVDHVGSRLAMVMLPLLLGSVAAGTLLSSAAAGAGSSLAAAALGSGVASGAVPAVPAAVGGGSAGGVAAASVSTTVVAVAAAGVVAAGMGVGAVGFATADQPTAADVSTTVVSQDGALADPLGIDAADQAVATVPDPVDPTAIPTEKPSSTPVPTTPPTTTTDDSTETETTTETTDDTADDTDDTTTTTTAPPTTTTNTKTGTGTTLTGTVDNTVTGLTGTVDGIVDGVLPEGDGLVGGVNDTLDVVTGTVGGLTDDVTDTVDGVTDLVGGLVGGLGGLLGG